MKSRFFYKLCFKAGRGGFVRGQIFCPVRDKLILHTVLSSNLSIDVSSIRSRALHCMHCNFKKYMYGNIALHFAFCQKLISVHFGNYRPPWNFARKLISVHHLIWASTLEFCQKINKRPPSNKSVHPGILTEN